MVVAVEVAEEQVGLAGGAFQLQRGMMDAVFIVQHEVDALLNQRARANGHIIREDVRRQ